MDIAMFTESYSENLDGKRRQVLITPHNDNVRVYSRLTDGTKGPHNKWEETTLDELTTEIQDEEILTRTPVGVYVTPPDQRAMTSKGYSPVLGTKACDKHDSSIGSYCSNTNKRRRCTCSTDCISIVCCVIGNSSSN